MLNQETMSIWLKEIKPGEHRVVLREMFDGHWIITRYFIQPHFEATLERWGYKDGSTISEELFRNLCKDGMIHKRADEPPVTVPSPREMDAQIRDFFELIETGQKTPEWSNFQHEVLEPLMLMGWGRIQEQFFIEIAYRLKDSLECLDSAELSAIEEVSRHFLRAVPSAMERRVGEILSFAAKPIMPKEVPCQTPAPLPADSPASNWSKRSVVLDMLKVIELEVENVREAIRETPTLFDGGSLTCSHPILEERFVDLLKVLVPSTHALAEYHEISLLGNGPWRSEQLENFLDHYGVRTGRLSAETNCVVVGYQNTEIGEVRDWLLDRDGDGLVYPQELLVIYLLSGKDPLPEISKEHANQWIAYHPVLRELFSTGKVIAPWPNIVPKDEQFDQKQEIIQWEHGESPLAKMGYSVGLESPLKTEARREILRRAFEGDIPRVDSHAGADKYMAQWGRPATSQRLWRIARHLAAQVNLKRQNPLMARAVSLWVDDLEWLYTEIYPKIRFRFTWPRAFGK